MEQIQRELGKRERKRWRHAPEGLAGTVLSSLDELRDRLPPVNGTGVVEELGDIPGSMIGDKGYVLLGRTIEGTQVFAPIAYQCGDCNSVVVGPPDVTDFDLEGTAVNSIGYLVNCMSCGAQMDSYEVDAGRQG